MPDTTALPPEVEVAIDEGMKAVFAYKDAVADQTTAGGHMAAVPRTRDEVLRQFRNVAIVARQGYVEMMTARTCKCFCHTWPEEGCAIPAAPVAPAVEEAREAVYVAATEKVYAEDDGPTIGGGNVKRQEAEIAERRKKADAEYDAALDDLIAAVRAEAGGETG